MYVYNKKYEHRLDLNYNSKHIWTYLLKTVKIKEIMGINAYTWNQDKYIEFIMQYFSKDS